MMLIPDIGHCSQPESEWHCARKHFLKGAQGL